MDTFSTVKQNQNLNEDLGRNFNIYRDLSGYLFHLYCPVITSWRTIDPSIVQEITELSFSFTQYLVHTWSQKTQQTSRQSSQTRAA